MNNNNRGLSQNFIAEAQIQANYNGSSSSSPQKVLAAFAKKMIFLTDVVISTDTAQNILLQDNSGTPAIIVPKLYLPANSVWSKTFSSPVSLTLGQELDVLCSGNSGNVSVLVTGFTL